MNTAPLILKEGTITIAPDGDIQVTGFSVKRMNPEDLIRLAEDRVVAAAERIARQRSGAEKRVRLDDIDDAAYMAAGALLRELGRNRALRVTPVGIVERNAGGAFVELRISARVTDEEARHAKASRHS